MAPARGICHRGQGLAFIAGRSLVTGPGWSRTVPALIMLLGMASLPAARAADPDVARLEREVAALKEVVQHLQARVDRLESPPTAAEQSASGIPRTAPPAPSETVSQAVSRAAPKAALPAAPIAALQPGADPLAASPQAQLRANWSKIEPGIDADEVSRLLGAPTRKLRLDGRSAWYYSYPALGNGSVFFTDADRVSSHQSPFGWGG
jgi:uncharacterized membrane protein